ncbi:MAG: response regulator [Archangiaceae bacterium]|nr:response regulator [Archangiaceae bacterium]
MIEDSPDDETLLIRALSQAGFVIEHLRVETAEDMRAALQSQTWDVVISDYRLPRFDAIGALNQLKLSKLDLPFIIVSGNIGEDAAVAAMRGGAHDYVMKSNLRRLPETLRREVKEAQLRRERRSLEEQVRQAQKMEAVGQLASGIAHDFNNLLTVILSFSQFVYDDLPVDHKGREDLREVVDCAARAAGLTRQLLTFSRRSVFDPQLIDLNTVLATTEKMLKRLLGKGIDYTTLPCADTAWAFVDRGLVEQVVVNLVVNARDAMPDGGKLTVETQVVSRDGKPFVMIAVTDTGVGMTPEVQQRIFEPFFTTKGEGYGTGLGLATVMGIVKECGGDIEVTSAPGRGTTFKVYLPRAPEATEARPAPQPSTLERGHETVLVVEDQAPVRAAVHRVLASTGYRVLEASRGRDALTLVEAVRTPVHLVLTDLQLPEMSGPDMVKKLRALSPEMKVLYMSGFAGGALSRQGIVEPGMSFLQKPFTPDVLMHKVRAALDGGGRS